MNDDERRLLIAVAIAVLNGSEDYERDETLAALRALDSEAARMVNLRRGDEPAEAPR